MERSFWPVHFRNLNPLNRRWHSILRIEDDYRASGQLGVVFLRMMRLLTKTRQRRLGAVCALAVAWACVPAAGARQQNATADTTAPAKAKTTGTAKTHPGATHSSSATKSASTSHTASTHTASNTKHSSRKKKSVRAKGQQKIDSERATAIQEALIREHYLSGEATGTWNQASEDAMRRYQGDHGWQTKEVPDSRALIRLGLGPDNAHLLNPESAMTSAPVAPQSSTAPPTSQTSAPVASPAGVSPAAQSPIQNDPPRPQ
jgi:hypothetical protein